MTSNRPAPGQRDLLDLPPEVRHQIYRHLFCHQPSPITLAREDALKQWAAFSPDAEPEVREPTFHTAIFRVNKAISRDALRYAYSANRFQLLSDLDTFCNLGATALASIKTLSVFNRCWSGSPPARAIWDTLSGSCPGLEFLIVRPASHVLFGAIPYLRDFIAAIPPDRARPTLVLELNVWERHFSFDFPDRDYRNAQNDLKHGPPADECTGSSSSPSLSSSYTNIMRMPSHVKKISFVLDVSPAAMQALDDFLAESLDLHLVKLDKLDEVPLIEDHHREGRRTRHYYAWEESAE